MDASFINNSTPWNEPETLKIKWLLGKKEQKEPADSPYQDKKIGKQQKN